MTFGFVSAGKGRVIILTLWASPDERKTYADPINALIGSVKPIQ